MSNETEARHRILLVDDDPNVLELYRHLLTKLPSNPEIFTTSSGARALTMLEEDSFRLLICDLRMPKVDGLQVLSIVRRKFPMLRTVALTSVLDEQFRSRAYGLGVDLFWHKPTTEQEVQMFLECLESLLGYENESGFRGIQSKSLMDIIQLECLSQTSAVLRIANGPQAGKIWIQDGDVIDAQAGELTGETAFYRILGWKNGTFETMAPEPGRERTILKPSNALLLEVAQAQDEAAAGHQTQLFGAATPADEVMEIDGVEFVLSRDLREGGRLEARGLENSERMGAWMTNTLQRLTELGEELHAGPIDQVDGTGTQRHVTLARKGQTDICVSWKTTLSLGRARELSKKVFPLWAS